MSEPISFATDVLIVGAGPAGLFATFQCGMLGLKTRIVDALTQPGGQCSALYPEKPIFDIPAMPKVTGAELIARLIEQAAPFKPSFHLGTHIQCLNRVDDRWRVGLSNGESIDCAAVIIASGAGLLRPNKPDWPGLDRFEGKGVHYGVLRTRDFVDRNVVIAGGGDSAADWAVELALTARSVRLIHRRDRFRAAPDTLRKVHELVTAGRIELLAPARVHGLDGDSTRLSRLDIEVSEARRWIDCDDLLLFFGLVTDVSGYSAWGLHTDGTQIRINSKSCATNLPGVFAIGDVAGYPGKLKLILAGFSEAATAAHRAHGFCRPGEELFFEYSTARGVPSTHQEAVCPP